MTRYIGLFVEEYLAPRSAILSRWDLDPGCRSEWNTDFSTGGIESTPPQRFACPLSQRELASVGSRLVTCCSDGKSARVAHSLNLSAGTFS